LIHSRCVPSSLSKLEAPILKLLFWREPNPLMIFLHSFLIVNSLIIYRFLFLEQ
jgi:hypothetical protein